MGCIGIRFLTRTDYTPKLFWELLIEYITDFGKIWLLPGKTLILFLITCFFLGQLSINILALKGGDIWWKRSVGCSFNPIVAREQILCSCKIGGIFLQFVYSFLVSFSTHIYAYFCSWTPNLHNILWEGYNTAYLVEIAAFLARNWLRNKSLKIDKILFGNHLC